jgi:hypothetical protein
MDLILEWLNYWWPIIFFVCFVALSIFGHIEGGWHEEHRISIQPKHKPLDRSKSRNTFDTFLGD